MPSEVRRDGRGTGVFGIRALSTFTLVLFSTLARAASVTVPGFSFESPVTTTWAGGAPAGWVYTVSGGGAGVQANSSMAMAGTTGSQYAFINHSHSLGSAASLVTIQANTTYTLTVDVANRSDFTGTVFALKFYANSPTAGGVVVATTGNLTEPADNTLRQRQLSWTALAGDSNVGKGLFIVLANTSVTSGQFEFDNVRLDAVSTSAPPVVALQPIGGTVNAGTAFTFTASAYGTEPLAFQWMKDSAPLSGQTNATLILANLAAGDTGDYVLRVTNDFGVDASSAAALSVNRPPLAADFSTRTVQKQTATLSVPELLARCTDVDGDAVTMVSVADGSSGSVEWVGSRIVYTPYPEFVGTDQFTFTVSDQRGGTGSAVVNIAVLDTNAVAPVIMRASLLLTNEGFHASGVGLPNLNYNLQSTTNLCDAWTNRSVVQADSAGAFEFAAQEDAPCVFYRLEGVDPRGQRQGASVQTPYGTASLDTNRSLSQLLVNFPGAGTSMLLTNAVVLSANATGLVMQCDVVAPGGAPLRITRSVSVQSQFDRTAMLETMSLASTGTWSGDLEIRRPFALTFPAGSSVGSIVPRSSGWAQSAALTGAASQWQYVLGYAPTAPAKLALPVVSFTNATARFSVMADPYYSALFAALVTNGNVEGEVRYTYHTSQVPLATNEIRRFACVIARNTGGGAAFADGVNDFFARQLSDVPAGPAWCKQIAMVEYDYLAEAGSGWTNDVAHLASWLTPAECGRVALCFHGWYESLGGYAFDNSTGGMKSSWLAKRTYPMSVATMRERLACARTNGFRVLLYFGDGLLTDSGFTSAYHDDWVYRDPSNNRITGWTGPDTFGTTYAMNPAHPQVIAFYTNYLAALLASVGDLVDGFVWDETFLMREGAVTLQPAPAHCDVAFMNLVKRLRRQVKNYDPQKVFLTSDCQYLFGADNIPGYAMVADGVYQDTWCRPVNWSYGLFANWRNTLWSCNWWPISNFDWTRYSALNFGAPISISNGWEDDLGPSEWSSVLRDRFLALFRTRLGLAPTTGRFLQQDPATYLANTYSPEIAATGDTIPSPASGETNWAAAVQGGVALASSTDSSFTPAGAIDGNRTVTGWQSGHGWASLSGTAMPVWFQVNLAGLCDISRFVVITYQSADTVSGGGALTRGKDGLLNYRIQIWNDTAHLWETVVTESRNVAMMTRVHTLAAAARTSKCRLVVDEVSGGDGVARLLQCEAWGTAP